MNKTSNCLKMLMYLYAHKGKPMSRQAIADYLETNVRNINVYRGELMEAGYKIDYLAGPYGGYLLNTQSLLHVPAMEDAEYDALLEARAYLSVHPDFSMYNEFESAMMSIACEMYKANGMDTKYLGSTNQTTSDSRTVGTFIHQIDEAIKSGNEITFEYRRSAGNDEWYKVHLHPYEYFYKEMKYYVNGYVTNNKSGKDYHNYVISEERMKNLRVLSKQFSRDPDYKLSDHVGKTSVVKENEIHLVLKVDKELRFYVRERRNGYDYSVEDKGDYLIVRTTFDNRYVCDAYVLGLGSKVEVLEPQETRERIKQTLVEMSAKY